MSADGLMERARSQAKDLSVARERLQAAGSLQAAVGQRLADVATRATAARQALSRDVARAQAADEVLAPLLRGAVTNVLRHAAATACPGAGLMLPGYESLPDSPLISAYAADQPGAKTERKSTVRIRTFGYTGLRVSELFLGTMTFGDARGWGAPLAECRKMLDAYAEAGGNVIDTANRYTKGESEQIVDEPLEVALAWTMARHLSVHPLVGARMADQLVANLAAADLVLPGQAVPRLDEVSTTEPGFPTDMIESTRDSCTAPSPGAPRSGSRTQYHGQ